MIRLLLILKHGKSEMKKLLHPQGSIYRKGKKNKSKTGSNVERTGFFHSVYRDFCFLLVPDGGAGVGYCHRGQPVWRATLGNIGPGLAGVGPMTNFSHIPGVGKWILSLCMLLGRLELYTVLILFMPEVWRKY